MWSPNSRVVLRNAPSVCLSSLTACLGKDSAMERFGDPWPAWLRDNRSRNPSRPSEKTAVKRGQGSG